MTSAPTHASPTSCAESASRPDRAARSEQLITHYGKRLRPRGGVFLSASGRSRGGKILGRGGEVCRKVRLVCSGLSVTRARSSACAFMAGSSAQRKERNNDEQLDI